MDQNLAYWKGAWSSRFLIMKAELLESICVEMRRRLDVLARAAKDAHAAATDPGSKAEGKYDTRSLEASYLASGQARQVEEMASALQRLESTDLPEFGPADPVGAGALVDVILGGESCYFLLSPVAGGMELQYEGRELTLLTPESPLYQKMLGLEVGDELEQPPLRVVSIK